jgi:integrase
MTRTVSQQLPVQPSGWKFPIDPSRYDRSATLTTNERRALTRLIKSLDSGAYLYLDGLPDELDRITKPLLDVLRQYTKRRDVQRQTMKVMLRRIHTERLVYWGWSDDVWITVFNALKGHPPSQAITDCRQHLFLLAYFLCSFNQLHVFAVLRRSAMKKHIFGEALIDAAVLRVREILRGWGYRAKKVKRVLPNAIFEALLFNRSPYLEDLTIEVLERLRPTRPPSMSHAFVQLSRVLVHLKIINRPLEPGENPRASHKATPAATGVSEEWRSWCNRWRETTARAPGAAQRTYYSLLKAGRWLAQTHPDISSPEQWTRQLAIEFVAAVDDMRLGDYTVGSSSKTNYPRHLAPRGKAGQIKSLRLFFNDLREWGWIRPRFDPNRYLAVPRSTLALIGPDPRVIADDIWAKLLWAGLNLTADDLAGNMLVSGTGDAQLRTGQYEPFYPLEMVQAMVVIWLFAGLRRNEIRRLRVGCIRWQRDEVTIPGTGETLAKDAVCLLDVPVGKTSTAFTKPVDRVVGEAVQRWEAMRPAQPLGLDEKTNERVHFLFMFRGKQPGLAYLNEHLIPLLCKKAGVPKEDARGPITSHRARSTIATQLYNSKEPLTLYELQQWLGHRTPLSTRNYTGITPLTLSKAYADAGYFERNLRTIAVLIDQDAILNGDAAKGLPWKYYDLGHGYCTYDFFDRCEHRMACARCAFYRPKDAYLKLLLEKKQHLLHMRQDIPLTDLELSAVEGDLEATQQLIAQLEMRQTPAGSTPRELGQSQCELTSTTPAIKQLTAGPESYQETEAGQYAASAGAQGPGPTEHEAENNGRKPRKASESARSSRPRAKRATTKQG